MQPAVHDRRDHRPGGAARVGGGAHSSSLSVTVIVEHRCTFESEHVTGRQIKETADVPEGFTLFRRGQGGNEAVPDDAQIELRNGDHFFARARKGVAP